MKFIVLIECFLDIFMMFFNGLHLVRDFKLLQNSVSSLSIKFTISIFLIQLDSNQ